MNFTNFIAASIEFPKGGDLISSFVFMLLEGLYNLIGSYGVAIIFFTLVLRLIMFPLDFGNKYFTKKNANKMAELKPEIDKLGKIYANDPLAKNRAQQEIFRRNGYSQGGFCFFMIINMVVTLLVFITVFGCLRDISNQNINQQFVELQAVYAEYDGRHEGDEFKEAINEKYNDTTVSFLWVKNFWRPDSWDSQTLSWASFKSTVGAVKGNVFASSNYLDPAKGYLADAADPEDPTKEEKAAAKAAYEADLKAQYNTIFSPIKKEHGGWNGFLLLIVLAGVTMYFSAVINANQLKKKAAEKKTSEEVVRYSMRETRAAPDDNTLPQINPAMMGNMMKFLLPAIMVIFTLVSTAALALYITVGAVISIGLTFVSNTLVDIILKKQGKKQKTQTVDTTIINPHTKYFKKK